MFVISGAINNIARMTKILMYLWWCY